MIYADPQTIYVIKNLSLSIWYYLPLIMLYLCWGMWKEKKSIYSNRLDEKAQRYFDQFKDKYVGYKEEIKEKTRQRLMQIEHHGSKTFEIKNYKKVSETPGR